MGILQISEAEWQCSSVAEGRSFLWVEAPQLLSKVFLHSAILLFCYSASVLTMFPPSLME
ncbi:MAG: hypothetical protein BGO67_05730 [Alphaproteobacteria bacterium 41-28]|nr:MAG: hypothetical protein BGO67_05730 [Alphaproteobacteria bacterium 41-28]